MEPGQPWDSLRLLEGDWRNFGTGGFPTIGSFEYREHLHVQILEGHEALHYLQSTWRIDGDEEHGSHIETGFISVEGDGHVLVLNSQGSDRVEALRGALVATEDSFSLNLASAGLFNDERMVSSWRELRFRESSPERDGGRTLDSEPEQRQGIRAVVNSIEQVLGRVRSSLFSRQGRNAG
jgi:hypothetical protein